MKKQILYALAVVLIFAACSKKMLREDEIIQKRDVLESAEPNLLLSSIIQKSAYTYYGLGGVNSTKLAVTMQYMQGNKSAGDNIYEGFQKPTGDLYSLTSQIKLVQAAIDIVHEKKLKVHEGIFTIFTS